MPSRQRIVTKPWHVRFSGGDEWIAPVGERINVLRREVFADETCLEFLDRHRRDWFSYNSLMRYTDIVFEGQTMLAIRCLLADRDFVEERVLRINCGRIVHGAPHGSDCWDVFVLSDETLEKFLTKFGTLAGATVRETSGPLGDFPLGGIGHGQRRGDQDVQSPSGQGSK